MSSLRRAAFVHDIGRLRGSNAVWDKPAGRILAAADSYQALTQDRPRRPSRSAADAAAELRAEVGSGRLDAAAVDAW